ERITDDTVVATRHPYPPVRHVIRVAVRLQPGVEHPRVRGGKEPVRGGAIPETSHDLPGGVDSRGIRAVGPRHLDCGERVSFLQEPMIAGGVRKYPNDLADVVDPCGPR